MTAPACKLAPDNADSSYGNRPAVRRLLLSHFRNYETLRLTLDDSPAVVLTGANGGGKTNLLEALSFLAPGRGLRRARLAEVDRIVSSANWALSAEIDGGAGSVRVGTGRDPVAAAAGNEKRLVRIDGLPARSHAALADHLAVSWLTPPMDRLFTDGAGGRRRFLDQLVHAFDSRHATRVSRYTHALRERARLLREGQIDRAWHAALEEQIATGAVAVAAARRGIIERMAPLAATGYGPFPGALMAVEGTIEDWLEEAPALAVEDRLRSALAAARKPSDGDSFTIPGPHRSDLVVRHSGKAMPAAHCSTGEQKALLIAILIAHARLRVAECGAAPLLLLDEVAAHLDSERRAALYRLLLSLGGQTWLTGTDAALFAGLGEQAQFFAVANGTLRRFSPQR